jgi:hypothetical protein
MPAGDGTGPIGMGPRTGRGAGYCSGYDVPGWANPMPGFGQGRGWAGYWGRGGGRGGGGRGRRNWYYATGVPGWARFGYAPAYGAPPAWGAPPTWEDAPRTGPAPEQEVEFLKRQAETLKHELEAIARRVEELTGGA